MNKLLRSSRHLTIHTKRAIAGYLFILPFILGFILFRIKPMADSLRMSFSVVNPKDFTMAWNGTTNYDYVLNVIPWFRSTITDNIYKLAVNTVATVTFSFVIAVVLNSRFHGRTLARAIFFLPVIFSAGVLLGLDYNLLGIKADQNMIVDMGKAIEEAGDVDLTSSLRNLLQTTGFATDAFQIVFDIIDGIYDVALSSGVPIIVFLSGMQNIDGSLYEAAHVEGCSAWEAFWMITFPMVSPLMLVNVIYTIVDYSTRSDNSVMEKVIEMMYVKYDFGVASAIAWLYMAIALGMIFIGAAIIKVGVKNYE